MVIFILNFQLSEIKAFGVQIQTSQKLFNLTSQMMSTKWYQTPAHITRTLTDDDQVWGARQELDDGFKTCFPMVVTSEDWLTDYAAAAAAPADCSAPGPSIHLLSLSTFPSVLLCLTLSPCPSVPARLSPCPPPHHHH